MRTACGKMVLALTLLVGISTVAQADFGAIAYSPETGKWGYSNGYYDLASAQSNAISRVGTSDARVAVWVQNGYAALARGSNGSYGWGWSGNSRADAETIALNNAGSGASIVCWVYSGE